MIRLVTLLAGMALLTVMLVLLAFVPSALSDDGEPAR